MSVINSTQVQLLTTLRHTVVIVKAGDVCAGHYGALMSASKSWKNSWSVHWTVLSRNKFTMYGKQLSQPPAKLMSCSRCITTELIIHSQVLWWWIGNVEFQQLLHLAKMMKSGSRLLVSVRMLSLLCFFCSLAHLYFYPSVHEFLTNITPKQRCTHFSCDGGR